MWKADEDVTELTSLLLMVNSWTEYKNIDITCLEGKYFS